MKPEQKIIARCDLCGYERCHKCGRASLRVEIVRDRTINRLE